MGYKLSNLFVLCVSFTIFGQDYLKQNGGVVWTGLSGCRWHVKKKEINQKPKKTSSIKFIVVHTPLRCVLMGQMFAPFGQ